MGCQLGSPKPECQRKDTQEKSHRLTHHSALSDTAAHPCSHMRVHTRLKTCCVLHTLLHTCVTLSLIKHSRGQSAMKASLSVSHSVGHILTQTHTHTHTHTHTPITHTDSHSPRLTLQASSQALKGPSNVFTPMMLKPRTTGRKIHTTEVSQEVNNTNIVTFFWIWSHSRCLSALKVVSFVVVSFSF